MLQDIRRILTAYGYTQTQDSSDQRPSSGPLNQLSATELCRSVNCLVSGPKCPVTVHPNITRTRYAVVKYMQILTHQNQKKYGQKSQAIETIQWEKLCLNYGYRYLYSLFVPWGCPYSNAVSLKHDGSTQLNSTENYGRRCLTPLSPHRNYILS